MAIVSGLVTGVVTLPPKKGAKKSEAARFVRVGGISVMVPRSVKNDKLPSEGDFIDLQTKTHWPKDDGSRPIEMYDGHRLAK